MAMPNIQSQTADRISQTVNQSRKKQGKQEEDAMSSFMNILSQNMYSVPNAGNSASQTVKQDKVSSSTSAVKKDSTKDSSNSTVNGDAKKPEEKETNSVKSEKPEKAEHATESGSAEEKGDLTVSDVQEEEAPAMEVISQLESIIMQQITSALDISEEELKGLLDSMGLKLTDLLDTGNLKDFFTQLNGVEDMTALLTDENLSEQFTELLNKMNQIELPDDAGMTKEELTALLQTAQENAQNSVNTAVQTVQAEENVPEVQDEALDGKESSDAKLVVSVEKEVNKAGKETADSMQGETGQREQKQDTMEQNFQKFVDNLTTKGTQQVSQDTRAARVDMLQSIVDQVVEQIKVAVKPEATHMEIQLNPESLGKVSIEVIARDGKLTATFTAETEMAKAAIEGQLQTLKETLSNQGLKVEAIDVAVSDFESEFRQGKQQGDAENQPKQSRRHQINLDDFNENAADVTEEEVLAAKVLEQNGGSIDYTA